MEKTVTEIAIDAIREAGWEPTDGPAAGRREYATVVGLKQALIWIGRRPDQAGNISVAGEFWSEGRNVLEHRGVLLNVEMRPGQVAGRVAQFLRLVEEGIQQSFAVRLLASA